MHIKERDISLFLENSLNNRKRKRLEEHFSVCKICKSKLKEWELFYSSLEQLETDFELDGMEDKIIQRLKRQQQNTLDQIKNTRIPMPTLFYVAFVIFTLSLLLEPIVNILAKLYNNIMAFMIDGGLQLVNKAKWTAVDIIAMFKSMELTGLFACIILIAGGIYLTINRKSVRKA